MRARIGKLLIKNGHILKKQASNGASNGGETMSFLKRCWEIKWPGLPEKEVISGNISRGAIREHREALSVLYGGLGFGGATLGLMWSLKHIAKHEGYFSQDRDFGQAVQCAVLGTTAGVIGGHVVYVASPLLLNPTIVSIGTLWFGSVYLASQWKSLTHTLPSIQLKIERGESKPEEYID